MLSRYNRKYTEQERIIIRSEIGITPLPALARRLGRTERGVAECAATESLYPESIAKRSAGLSFSDVCLYLGINKKTLFCFVRAGHITATRILVHRRAVYTFTYDEVERFLRERGGLYDMRPVAGWQEVYSEARDTLRQRLIARTALFRALCLSDRGLWPGFPAPVCTGSRGAHYFDRAAVIAWMDRERPPFWTARARREVEDHDRV